MITHFLRSLLLTAFVLQLNGLVRAEEPEQSTPVITHQLESPFQAGPTTLRIVMPTQQSATHPLMTIYMLPVEAGLESRYGYPVKAVLNQKLHEKYSVLFAFPTFTALPWYADHPTDKTIQQESHLLKTVIPFVEQHYPVGQDADHRYLLGYSKSGWGAWSLILRNPHLFARASAWDAPLAMTKIGRYGNGPIFGTQENFEHYCVTNLLSSAPDSFRKEPRLILTGYENFRDQHLQILAILSEQKIQLTYRDGPIRKHHWESGWVEEAVQLLLDPHHQ